MRRLLCISTLMTSVFAMTVPAVASELLTNGGFTTGFTGWSTTIAPGSSGDFSIDSTNVSPQGYTTAGPINGNYAITDQSGPGAYSLTQTFTVAAGATTIVTFDLFTNNFAGNTHCGTGLDYTAGSAECARVDILTGTAGAFDTGTGVLTNLYTGSDLATPPSPWHSYSFNVSSALAAGGTFQIRFGEVDNESNFQLGVDNVSVTSTAPVPEPGSLVLIGTGLLGGVGAIRRKLKR